MKMNKFFALAMAAAFTLSSCSLDTPTYDHKSGEGAFSTLKDINNGLNGCYYYAGHYGFLGNYAVILGDMCGGVSNGSASSGHFYSFSTFTFSETESELEYVWMDGYKIVTGATTVINEANAKIDAGAISESALPDAYNYLGQAYALKALANYYLVNMFALPYSQENLSKPGIIVIDKENTKAFAQVSRGTIEDTYAQIVKDMKAAEAAFAEAGDAAVSSAYYMGMMGLKALEARVYLSMGKYTEAETAAKAALELKGNGNADAADVVPSDEAYLKMWGNVAVNDEDLFTIKKSDDDNLSANSLSTAYGSYYCTFQNAALSKLGANDIRRQLLRAGDGGGTSSKKYDGQSAAAVSNIPVFRKSEMALIIAECEARNGSIEEAKKYLMFTAKRNKDIESVDNLPSTKDELLQFISDERVREFFGEGHRFFDARRMGEKISGDQFQNWDIKKFVFPIPSAEINTGTGCAQNANWSDALPTLLEE